MKSKGGKREYYCPQCGSANIYPASARTTFHMMRDKGICAECNSFWLWSRRINLSIADPAPIIIKNVTTMQRFKIILKSICTKARVICQ